MISNQKNKLPEYPEPGKEVDLKIVVAKFVKMNGAINQLPEEFYILDIPEHKSVVFGRSQDNTIVVEDKTISKKHCLFDTVYTRSNTLGNMGQGMGGQGVSKHITIKDFSSFGSYVNNQVLGKGSDAKLLMEGDLITFRRPRDDSPGDFRVHYGPAFSSHGDEAVLSDETVSLLQMQMQAGQQGGAVGGMGAANQQGGMNQGMQGGMNNQQQGGPGQMGTPGMNAQQNPMGGNMPNPMGGGMGGGNMPNPM